MHWLRRLWAQLLRPTPASAQRRASQADRALAELRAKVRALPAEQQVAFAKELQALIDAQAQAHNALNDALDDRHNHS